ncbi:MAG: hypothetical protein EA379_09915 [Phycisphaerales bacterium]|nr:MAG: hypothetical protein EA379_09915 [Phycisphaerales bacterium]
MKMKSMFVAAALVAVGTAGVASATLESKDVAYWAFNNEPLPGGGFGYQPGVFPLAAGFGNQAGVATVSVVGGITGETIVNNNGDTVFRWIQSFAGTTQNAQYGEPSGGSLAIQGGTDTLNNGAQIVINFDASEKKDLNFSFAAQRTATGFNDVSIAAFSGGSFLGNIATSLNFPTSFATFSFDASILDGLSDAQIVFTLNGAGAATGNNRYDNFFITGAVIPTPGAIALAGLAGLVGVRRRR